MFHLEIKLNLNENGFVLQYLPMCLLMSWIKCSIQCEIRIFFFLNTSLVTETVRISFFPECFLKLISANEFREGSWLITHPCLDASWIQVQGFTQPLGRQNSAWQAVFLPATQVHVNFSAHPYPAWQSLEDGPASFSWERQGALGCLSTMCRNIREVGAILPTASLKRIPKRGEEKSNLSPTPLKKGQYIEPSGKVSDGSVKPSIHQHSRERSVWKCLCSSQARNTIGRKQPEFDLLWNGMDFGQGLVPKLPGTTQTVTGSEWAVHQEMKRVFSPTEISLCL